MLCTINDMDWNIFVEHEVIDGIKNKKGFDYNCFINRDLNGIICKCKSLYNQLGLWHQKGFTYHNESDITRLQHLLDHRTLVCIDLTKVPLYLEANPNELKAPLIKIPALFNFLNNGSIKYTNAIINQQKKYDDNLGFGLDNYFKGFNTYYVNPMFFKYGDSIGICHIPNLRWENGTDIIVRWINKAFVKKYDQYLFFLHGDETYGDLRE